MESFDFIEPGIDTINTHGHFRRVPFHRFGVTEIGITPVADFEDGQGAARADPEYDPGQRE